MVQQSWKAMSEEEKSFYKDQSQKDRNEYDQKRKTHEELRAMDPELNKLVVIEGIQDRRAEREANKLKK